MNSDKELRELDKWIAVNVMGWKRGDVRPSRCFPDYIIDGLFNPEGILDCVPDYHCDPASAMLVLEKCASHAKAFYGEPILLEDTMHGYKIGLLGRNQDNTRRTTAETWPLAICKFAKALFTKG